MNLDRSALIASAIVTGAIAAPSLLLASLYAPDSPTFWVALMAAVGFAVLMYYLNLNRTESNLSALQDWYQTHHGVRFQQFLSLIAAVGGVTCAIVGESWIAALIGAVGAADAVRLHRTAADKRKRRS